jgi:hypothetical protein
MTNRPVNCFYYKTIPAVLFNTENRETRVSWIKSNKTLIFNKSKTMFFFFDHAQLYVEN